jgi:chromosome partitioning protein
VASFDELRLQVEGLPHLHLLPSDRDLVGVEVELVDQEEREFRLSKLLKPRLPEFSHAFIDCPPSTGLLTLNALAAADAVLIPVQCEYLALEGITQLVETVQLVRKALNPQLEIAGVLMTMYDERTNLSRQVVEEVRSVFGDQVFHTVIPRNIRLGEAPSHGLPIFLYDIRSKGAEAYLDLAKEFLEHEAKSTGQGATQPDSGDPATVGTAVAPAERAADAGDAGGATRREDAGGSGAAADRSGPDPAERRPAEADLPRRDPGGAGPVDQA